MKICRAIKTNWVTQFFGENKVSFYKEMGMLGHNGWDWAVKCKNRYVSNPKCEPIYFDVFDSYGKVISLSNEINEGRGVVIITNDKDGIFKHRYWHFHSTGPKLKVGDIISPGTLLGWAGNSGKYTTGAHLHRDIKPMGENKYGNYFKLKPNNGYFGAIDIKPYFKSIFILDLIEKKKKNIIAQISLMQQVIKLLIKLRDFIKADPNK